MTREEDIKWIKDLSLEELNDIKEEETKEE